MGRPSVTHALALRRLVVARRGARRVAAGALRARSATWRLTATAPFAWLGLLAVLTLVGARLRFRPRGVARCLAAIVAAQAAIHVAMTVAPWAFGLAPHHEPGPRRPRRPRRARGRGGRPGPARGAPGGLAGPRDRRPGGRAPLARPATWPPRPRATLGAPRGEPRAAAAAPRRRPRQRSRPRSVRPDPARRAAGAFTTRTERVHEIPRVAVRPSPPRPAWRRSAPPPRWPTTS